MKITYPITEHGIKAQKQVLCMNLLAIKCSALWADG